MNHSFIRSMEGQLRFCNDTELIILTAAIEKEKKRREAEGEKHF
jgi:hypothetical protein